MPLRKSRKQRSTIGGEFLKYSDDHGMGSRAYNRKVVETGIDGRRHACETSESGSPRHDPAAFLSQFGREGRIRGKPSQYLVRNKEVPLSGPKPESPRDSIGSTGVYDRSDR